MIHAFYVFMDTILDLGRFGGLAVIIGWLLVRPKDKIVWFMVIATLILALANGYMAYTEY